MSNRKSAPRRSNVTSIALARNDGYSARQNGKWRVNDAPELTDLEIKFLQIMIRDNRLSVVCKWIGVDSSTLMRACAGFGDRMNPETMGSLRAFFAEADLESARKRGEPGRDSPPKRGLINGKRKAAGG